MFTIRCYREKVGDLAIGDIYVPDHEGIVTAKDRACAKLLSEYRDRLGDLQPFRADVLDEWGGLVAKKRLWLTTSDVECKDD